MERSRVSIIDQWVHRLLSAKDSEYSRRPKAELIETVAQAFEANFQVITGNHYHFINHFIDFITRLRLEAGFTLQDVQQAFEIFRDVVLPMVHGEAGGDDLYHIIVLLNRCLAYTIFRFSDRFQELHEKQLVDLACQLKAEVELCTSELRESELNYKPLVEEIQDGYLVIQDGLVIYVNAAFCRMHGCAMEDVLQQPFARFIAPEDQCGVTGSLDKDQLIKPRAFVVLNKGFEGTPVLEKELKEYVKTKLTQYKYPRWIEFMDELPKTATGKIKRFLLKDFAPKEV